MGRLSLFPALAALMLFPVLSCTENKAGQAQAPVTAEVAPEAVLQAGEYPLWFKFSGSGPQLIDNIEEAMFSAAFIPWPHAPHARFMLPQAGGLFMAVNRDGIIRFSPVRQGGTDGTGMYRVSNGSFRQSYTVGAFVKPEAQSVPVALLYSDEWFTQEDLPPPLQRLWTFSPTSPAPVPLSLAALGAFAPEDGWNIDELRLAANGGWYFRAARRESENLLMLRTDSLESEGNQVSLGEFQNSARPQPLSQAPEPLKTALAAVFAQSGYGTASVISPDFQSYRLFSDDVNGSGEAQEETMSAFFMQDGFLLAVTTDGESFFVKPGNPGIRRFSLPALPEGFVYTGTGMAGDTVIATWEEQNGFSIGAAGFTVLKPPELSWE